MRNMKPGLALFILGLTLVLAYILLSLAIAPMDDDEIPTWVRHTLRGILALATLAIGAGLWLE